MARIVVLLAAVAFSWLAAKSLKRLPWVYYALALALSMLSVFALYEAPPRSVVHVLADCVQKGYVGFSFITVVMFVGVFSRDSRARRVLGPVRGELSIVATLFMIAHVVPYVSGYLAMLGFMGSLRASVLASLGIAVVLVVLLLVLAVASVKVVRRAMPLWAWKNVQRLAYVFYVLAFVHLAGFLIVPHSSGATGATVALAYYGVLLVAYATLRVRRAVIDSKEKVA